jgi:predicted nuclease of predicted toxin-antitoxin system
MTPDERNLFVSLYLDEDVSDKIAQLLRDKGYHAVSVYEVGLGEDSDEAQLIYATAHQMTVLTCNEKDFLKLAQQWTSVNHTYHGILVTEQFSLRQTGEFMRRLSNFLDRVAADEMINLVRYLSDFK